MCIIVAKEMGVEMPDMATLQRCFWSNPDGAGFMYADGKNVRIRKGFMDWEAFEDALTQEFFGRDTTELGIVMHFRIATHGKVRPGCCHPFPISNDPEKLRESRCESRFGVAHNGVISGRATNDNWSDTMDFVADVMTPLMRMNSSFMFSDDALELLQGACGSKLAIMNHAGDIRTVGEFIENDGVLYSNSTFQRKVYSASSYHSLWENEYISAYPQYKDFELTKYNDDPDWETESLPDLIERLPFTACQECLYNEECALTCCECTNEKMAEDVALYSLGLTEDYEEYEYEETEVL